MGFHSDLLGFHSDFMGFHSDLMGFHRDFMGFHSDFMGLYKGKHGFIPFDPGGFFAPKTRRGGPSHPSEDSGGCHRGPHGDAAHLHRI